MHAYEWLSGPRADRGARGPLALALHWGHLGYVLLCWSLNGPHNTVPSRAEPYSRLRRIDQGPLLGVTSVLRVGHRSGTFAIYSRQSVNTASRDMCAECWCRVSVGWGP